MAGLVRQRSSDSETAAQSVAPALPVVANRAATAGNAAMQDRLKEAAPETGGAEQGGGGQATAAPSGAPTPPNDVQNTLRDIRSDQNFDNPPRSMGEVKVGKNYTYGDQVTARTSKGRGDSVILDYTRDDGSQKQLQGGKNESADQARQRLAASQANKTKPIDRGFVDDATQRRTVEVSDIRTAESGRVIVTYTDLDGKSKEYAGKAGESAADVMAKFTNAKARIGVPVERSATVQKSPLWQGIQGKVESVQKTLWAADTGDKRVAAIHDETNAKLSENWSVKGTTDVASAQGKAGAKATVGGGKAHAEAGVEGSAKLVAFERTWTWEPPARELLGETVSGKVYVYVKGFVGIEAQARIEANAQVALKKPKLDAAQLLAGSGLEVDANGAAKLGQAAKDRVGADVGAKAQGFAGAKLNIGVGAEGYWHKKEASGYARQLKENATTIVDLLSIANPGLGWVLRQMGAEKAAEKLLKVLFSWGSAGKTSLLAIEGGMQGSAGVGASAEAQMKFSGGKLQLKLAAGVTWGLGLGGTVAVVFDALEGVKFALIVMGELRPIVTEWVGKHVSDVVGKAGELFDGVMDWFGADDKVRDAVKNHAHEVVDASQRAQMCDTLYGGWFSGDDEEAVMTILRFSKSKGDLSRVLSSAPGGLIGSLSRQHRAEIGV